jgi:hypothetical protein
MAESPAMIPIMYTSYEDFKKMSKTKIARGVVFAKVKELTNCELHTEECDSLVYTIIETLQQLEQRDKVFSAIQKRIIAYYNMDFPDPDITDILKEPDVYRAGYNYINKKTIENKKILDDKIAGYLIGMEPPDETAPKAEKIKFRDELKLFKERNKAAIIAT